MLNGFHAQKGSIIGVIRELASPKSEDCSAPLCKIQADSRSVLAAEREREREKILI